MTCYVFHVFYLFAAPFFPTCKLHIPCFYSAPINTQFPVTVPDVFLVMVIVTISAFYNPISMSISLAYMGIDDGFTSHKQGLISWASLLFCVYRLSDLLFIVLC